MKILELKITTADIKNSVDKFSSSFNTEEQGNQNKLEVIKNQKLSRLKCEENIR